MNWDALGAIAETLGAIGIFATLIYLAVQVRHNSALIQQQQNATTAANTRDTFLMLQDPFVRESVYRAFNTEDELTDEQTGAAEGYLISALIGFTIAWRQYRQGHMSAAEWEGWRTQIGLWFTTTWPRAWWQVGRGAFMPDGFAAEIDSIIAATPLSGSHNTRVNEIARQMRAEARTEEAPSNPTPASQGDVS